jgi:hypothetical protein
MRMAQIDCVSIRILKFIFLFAFGCVAGGLCARASEPTLLSVA